MANNRRTRSSRGANLKQQLLQRLESFARPEADFSSIKATFASLQAAKAWDAAHPELALERREILVELERIEAEEQRAEADRRHIERVLRCIADSGLGQKTAEAAEAPKDTLALTTVRNWFGATAGWLVLSGGNGVGKTVAAAWALRESAKLGRTIAFRRAHDLVSLSKFDAGASEIAALKRVNLLVVDDFGAEHFTAYGQGLLGGLFDARHESYVRTIVTTNLSIKELRAVAGERIADRWRQDGAVVSVQGQSMRRKVEQKP